MSCYHRRTPKGELQKTSDVWKVWPKRQRQHGGRLSICVAEDQNTLCLKERSSQKRITQNLNFKEENSSRFYSWGLQQSVVKKVCSKAFFPPPFLGDDNSGVVCWLVDTFISVELLTVWVWHGLGCHRPLLNLFRNLPGTVKISLLGFQFDGSIRRFDDRQWKQ